MRAVHHVAEKVCSSREERSAFIKIGSLVTQERNGENVRKIFRVLAGEMQADQLPENLQQSLTETTVGIDTDKWKQAKSWAQWWTRPLHLSEWNLFCDKIS